MKHMRLVVGSLVVVASTAAILTSLDPEQDFQRTGSSADSIPASGLQTSSQQAQTVPNLPSPLPLPAPSQKPVSSSGLITVVGNTSRVDCIQDGPGCGDVFLMELDGKMWKLLGSEAQIDQAQSYPQVKILGAPASSSSENLLRIVSVEPV